MIILTLALGAAAFCGGYHLGRRRQESIISALRVELEGLRDPETVRIAALRRAMQQEQSAFNLLCNYGTELAYGQVSAADLMNKGGKAE